MNTTIIEEVQHLLKAGAAKSAWTLFEVHGEAETPSHVDSCLLGAMALQKMGRIDDALVRIETWINADSQNASNPYVLRMAGFLLVQLGKPDAAMRYLQAAKANFRGTDPNTEQAILRITGNMNHSSSSAGTKPGNDQFAIQADKNSAFWKRLHFGIKIPQLFTDWSDKLACCLWIIQIASLTQFLVRPNWKSIDSHPTFVLLKRAIDATTTIQLSTHALLVVGAISITVLAGMAAQIQSSQVAPDERLVFHQTRRLWSFHMYHVAFLLSLAASLYFFNNPHITWLTPPYQHAITWFTGLIAFGLGCYCVWLLLPGARPRYSLVITPQQKGNRLIVTQGVLMLGNHVFLPQMVKDCQLKKNLWWMLTFTRDLELNLSDGEKLTLAAPGSMRQAQSFCHAINTAIRDAKTTVDNGATHNSKY